MAEESYDQVVEYFRRIGIPPITKITSNIYLGSIEAATDSSLLKELGITHIINAAKDAKYNSGKIKQIKLELDDVPEENLFRVLEPSRMVINRILVSGSDHKILVHCIAGISRSASVVIYHLMKSKNWSFDRAKEFVKSKRIVINPNAGFEKTLRSV